MAEKKYNSPLCPGVCFTVFGIFRFQLPKIIQVMIETYFDYVPGVDAYKYLISPIHKYKIRAQLNEASKRKENMSCI